MERRELILKSLTSANNNTWLELYKPGTGLSAEIRDFFVTISLKSIEELPEVGKPAGIEIMSESEIDAAWREATRNADKKILNISFKDRQGNIADATEFTIMRVTPSYTENCLVYLTAEPRLLLPEGCSILCKIKEFNSGFLAGEDKLSFRITAIESNNLDADTLAEKYLT